MVNLPQALKAVFLLGAAIIPAVVNAQFAFTTNNDGSLNIAGFAGSGVVIIPSMTNGLQVTTIGTSAFQNLNGLTAVTIPDTITSIGNFAFASCLGLGNVTMGN